MSDYVISRKRSRPSGAYAVDPCLGYYVLQSNNSLENSLNYSRKQRSSSIIENLEERNVVSLSDYSTIPSSLPDELELESPSTETFLDLDYEDTTLLEATDWVELVPSRSKLAPCLVGSESRSATAFALNVNESTDALTNESHHLTVEGFLKRSHLSKSNAGKTYRVKKIKSLKARATKTAEPTKIGDNGDCDGHKIDDLKLRSRNIPRAFSEDHPSDFGCSSPEYESSSICDTPKIIGPGSVKRKRRNLSKPLKERIFEAAIATHVNPEDDFAQDKRDPARPPLRFVPGSAKDVLRKRKKKKNWALIDPRKSRSMCTASFSSNPQRTPKRVSSGGFARLSHTLDRLPMESWKWDAVQGILPVPHSRSSITRKYPQNQAVVLPPIISDYPPLMLVPLNNAESDYMALFQGRRKRDSTDNDKKTASKKRKGEPLCPPNLQFTSLTDRFTKRIHSSKRNKKTAIKPPMLTMLPIPAATTSVRSRSILSSAMRDVNYPSTPCGKEVAESRHLSSPIEPTLSSRTPVAIESSATMSSILPFPTQWSLMPANHSTALDTALDTQQHPVDPVISGNNKSFPSDKPFKPLESFMDEFLENIRNVNKQILEVKSKDKHSRPSKITRRRSSQDPCIVITPGAIKSKRLQENNMPLDSQLSGYSIPNEAEVLGRCPSPEILSLLEPKNYQVMLGSR